jgi:hypothetical protein
MSHLIYIQEWLKKKNLWTSCYALGFSLFAVAINLINLIIQILS